MHHTILMPRCSVWRLASAMVLLLSTLAISVRAQDGGPPSTTIEVPLSTTKLVEMSKKQLIKEVRSENPAIASIIVDTPRSALITARAQGSTRIFLIDTQGNEEFANVIVPSDNEQRRRAVLHLLRQTVPTANIDLVPGVGPKVVATGVVGNAEHLPIVLEVIGSQFGGPGNVVNGMRIGGVQQVQLDVVVARVNRTETRNIGFSFLVTGQNQFVGSTVGGSGSLAASTLTSILAPSTSLTSLPNVVFGLVDDSNGFIGFLNALRSEGLAKLMAQPSITTLTGRPAQIVSGGETPVLTSSGTGAPSVTYKQFGTVVDVLPIVLGDGTIHLDVQAQVSALNAGAGISITTGAQVTSVPGFDTRSAKAAVQMQDGQTLAIGGLIQSTINGTATKVPVLGDLPFLGAAFRSMSYQEIEEELVILVTPRLVHPFACSDWPKYLPGQETRSPDDFELFLEGILEAPRGQRSPCLGGHYHAAHKTGPTAGVYPCGDNGKGCGRAGCNHGQGFGLRATVPAAMNSNSPVRSEALPKTVKDPPPAALVQPPAAEPAPEPAPEPAVAAPAVGAPAVTPERIQRPETPRDPTPPLAPVPEGYRQERIAPDTLPNVPPPPPLGPVGVEGPVEILQDVSPVPVPDPEIKLEPE